jgi:hypothetical protein
MESCHDSLIFRLCYFSLYQNYGITITALTQKCAVAMTSCVIPLGQVYNWPGLNAPQAVYSTSEYNPALGPFTVNAWGLDYLSSNLQPVICQGQLSISLTYTRVTSDVLFTDFNGSNWMYS